MRTALFRPAWVSAVLLTVALTTSAIAAETRSEHLARVLRIDDVIEILREEGRALGAEIDRDMLNGRGGDWFADQVDALYDPGRIRDAVHMAIAATMTVEEIDQSVAFFTSERGRRILSLEVSARRAMMTKEIEDTARRDYEKAREGFDPKLEAIRRLITVNDLIERNVRGTMWVGYSFRRGLVDGGASQQTDEEIKRDVRAELDSTRNEARAWLYSYMWFAYGPLSAGDLDAYIDYSRTPSGQALNNALFDGFDRSYDTISRELGVMVAQAVIASDL